MLVYCTHTVECPSGRCCCCCGTCSCCQPDSTTVCISISTAGSVQSWLHKEHAQGLGDTGHAHAWTSPARLFAQQVHPFIAANCTAVNATSAGLPRSPSQGISRRQRPSPREPHRYNCHTSTLSAEPHTCTPRTHTDTPMPPCLLGRQAGRVSGDTLGLRLDSRDISNCSPTWHNTPCKQRPW
jgi:hypothetical protein